MSSSICYLTKTDTTTAAASSSSSSSTDYSPLLSLHSLSANVTATAESQTPLTIANNKKKKKSKPTYDLNENASCALSYLTKVNTDLNSNFKNSFQTQHQHYQEKQIENFSNNKMLVNSSLNDYLNEYSHHPSSQSSQSSNILIVNFSANGNSHSNDTNELINFNLITSPVLNHHSSTPPQLKQKKKVQFISNDPINAATSLSSSPSVLVTNNTIDPVNVILLSNESSSASTSTASSATSATLSIEQINKSIYQESNLTNNNNKNSLLNSTNPVFTQLPSSPTPSEQTQQKQYFRRAPPASIIRNKTNSLNRNFTPSPSCPYSYSFCLINNNTGNSNRQSFNSYKSSSAGTTDQSNKSQTIPYLSSYSYAAAANRYYRNSDTKHSYQFMTNRQHYHHNIQNPSFLTQTKTQNVTQTQTPMISSATASFSSPNYIRSSMTMPAIYKTMTATANNNLVYSPNRSYRNTSLHTFLMPPSQHQSEKENPFRPEGELAKEAEEFVQKLKEKQEADINQIILNATTNSSTTPLPSPNSTLTSAAAAATATTTAVESNEHQSNPSSSPSKPKAAAAVDAPTTLPTPSSPQPQNKSQTTTTPVNQSSNNNKSTNKTTTTNTNNNNNVEKKKQKPKCGCTIS